MDYLNNYLSKKCSDYSESELKKEISIILKHTFEYTNRTPINQNQTISNFINDLGSYKNITIEEVKQALRNGMQAKYGEIKDISNTVLFSWISKYMNEPERKNKIDDYRKKNELILPELTEKQEWEIRKVNYKNLFEGYKSGLIVKIHDFQGLIYDKLKELGFDLIDFNNFVDEAKKEMIREQTEKKIRTATDLREIKQVIKSIEGSENSRIVYVAKSLSLMNLFDDLETLEL